MNTPSRESTRPETAEDDEINLLDLVLVLVRYKRLLWTTPTVLSLLAVAYVLLATPIYEAETSLLPPQQQQSAASMLSQLGGLAGAAGGALGLKSPNDLYIAMLKSREIGARLAGKFNLPAWYGVKTQIDTLKALGAATTIESGKDGLILITVADRSPQLAANLANAYVEELRHLSKTMAVTEAAQRRVFFENQLMGTRAALADAEVALKQLQQKTGLLQLDAQGKVAIEAVAGVRAQISVRQVQLAALKNYATDQNPEVQRLRAELDGLQGQLNKVSGGADGADALFSQKGMPEVGLEYVRKMRDLKYQEMLFDLMSKQYELAKVDEAKDGASVQVLDKAVPPERKSKPKRVLTVLLAAMAGIFFGIVLAFVREGLSRLNKDPEQQALLSQIKAEIRR